MSDAPIPSVIAMLVCDQVITEQGSGKKSLIGVFERLNAFAFPTLARLAIYAKLVDAAGQYEFRVRLVNLKNESRVAELKTSAQIKEGITGELVINLGGIPFPEAGKYEFQLYANEIYLHRVTITVAQAAGGGPVWPQQKLHQ
jgi:hypothetical protein